VPNTGCLRPLSGVDALVAQDRSSLIWRTSSRGSHLRDCVGCCDRHPELERRFHEHDVSLLESFPAYGCFRLLAPDGLLQRVACEAFLEDAEETPIPTIPAKPMRRWTYPQVAGKLVAWRSLLLAAQIGRKLWSTRHFANPKKTGGPGREGRGDATAAQFVPN